MSTYLSIDVLLFFSLSLFLFLCVCAIVCICLSVSVCVCLSVFLSVGVFCALRIVSTSSREMSAGHRGRLHGRPLGDRALATGKTRHVEHDTSQHGTKDITFSVVRYMSLL